jgi:hypothetical protein
MRQALQEAIILLGRIEARRDKNTRAEVRHFLARCRANPPFNRSEVEARAMALMDGCSMPYAQALELAISESDK